MAAERPGSQPERPASQMSGAGKRKSSPKFHFLKNHRHKPNPIGARANTPGKVIDLLLFGFLYQIIMYSNRVELVAG